MLDEFVTRRRQVIEMMTAEGNRARQIENKRLKKRIEQLRSILKTELTAIDADLDEIIRGTPAWRESETKMSDCLSGRARCHGVCSLKMALRMTSSLRMQASRRNPVIAVFYQRLVAAGKCKKLALTAP